MFLSSDSVGLCPSDRMTIPSSSSVILPSRSLSNRLKASLNSAICSSVKPYSSCEDTFINNHVQVDHDSDRVRESSEVARSVHQESNIVYKFM